MNEWQPSVIVEECFRIPLDACIFPRRLDQAGLIFMQSRASTNGQWNFIIWR